MPKTETRSPGGRFTRVQYRFIVELDGRRSMERYRSGKQAGCRSIRINRGYKEKQPDPLDAVFVSSLKEAVDYIMNSHNKMNGGRG